MKKFVLLCLTLLLSLIATGCGEKTSSNTTGQSKSESEISTNTPDTVVNTASIGDINMDYIKFGAGEKIFVILPGLSIHSVMGSADAVAVAYQSLCDKYTVYLFDRRSDVTGGYTIRDMASDTAEVMQSLGISTADVFGVSQGGMIAQYLAIDHPDMVNKLILGSTLSCPNGTSEYRIENWIRLAEEHDETALLESFVDKVYSAATLEKYRDTLIEMNRGITDDEYNRFIIMASACLDFNCYDELDSITCPVLVLGAEEDKVVTGEALRETAGGIANCELYIYPDTYGHAVYDEAPDYLERCREFLDK